MSLLTHTPHPHTSPTQLIHTPHPHISFTPSPAHFNPLNPRLIPLSHLWGGDGGDGGRAVVDQKAWPETTAMAGRGRLDPGLPCTRLGPAPAVAGRDRLLLRRRRRQRKRRQQWPTFSAHLIIMWSLRPPMGPRPVGCFPSLCHFSPCVSASVPVHFACVVGAVSARALVEGAVCARRGWLLEGAVYARRGWLVEGAVYARRGCSVRS